MSKVDDLGIEVDEDVEKALADPKSAILSKVITYFLTRTEKQKQLDQIKREQESKKSGVFDNLFQ